MSAFLSQATAFPTLIFLLVVWSGVVLLTTALLPNPVGYAKAAVGDPPARLMRLGLVAALAFVLMYALFHTGVHKLKLVGAVFVLIAFAVSTLGLAGLSRKLADWISSRPGMKPLRKSPVPTVIAAVLVVAPIAVPFIGPFVLAPLLFLITAGAGMRSFGGLVRRRSTPPISVRHDPPGVRIVFAAVGVLLLLPIGPIRDATSVQRVTVMFAMIDGTQLATDVYLPSGDGPFPVILIRTPYNKDQDISDVQDGVKRGYAVVVQDSRGRNKSHGENLPFAGETDERPNDGWATLEWLSEQKWCNGIIGTMGASVKGINQISTDGSGTDHVKSQHIAFAAPSLYQYMVYPGGIFRKKMVETWLKKSEYGPNSLAEWVAHPKYDDYWLARDFVDDDWERVNWPAMHIGGWYDIFSQGTLDTFVDFQMHGGTSARQKQKLIMGPWGHTEFSASIGDLTFPNGASPEGNPQEPWRWFDYSLRQIQNGDEKLPAVTYYVMGDTSTPGAPGNKWRTADQWPPVDATVTPYYLHSGKQLSPTAPAKDAPVTYTFDPKNPVPTLGGPLLYIDPRGPVDQRKIEDRPDVLTFTTEALTDPVEVTGRVRMKLFISSDAPDTDFFVKLCDVYPDGKVFNICEGQLRARFHYGFLEENFLKPGDIYPLDIDLWSTSMIFNKGHKIQLLVTSSNSPAFDVNPNTGDPFRANDRTQPAHNTIYMDSTHASAIQLPIVR